jgi:putative transposase
MEGTFAMSRPRRHLPAGLIYHVINRGNERRTLFLDSDEYQEFLDLMRWTHKWVPMRVCGLCLMPNHWHMLLWPEVDHAISAYMHRLATTHAVLHRRRLSLPGTGHVYQGRFRAFAVQDSRYYFTAMKYVEANPVRAGLVPRAGDWRWTSLSERLMGTTLIVPGPLELPSNWPHVVNGPERWRDTAAIRRCVQSDRPFGPWRWVARTAALQGLEQKLRVRGRPPKAEMRPK